VERFRKFIHSMIDEASALLSDIICDKDATIIKSIDLDSIQDDMTDRRVGMSFVDNALNGLDNDTGVLNRMVNLGGFSEDMLEHTQDNDGDDGMRFKPLVIKQMQAKIERFLGLLLALVYLTAGQPPRGTELVTARHSNAVAGPRTVYVHDGKVMIVTK